jgi:hypothetical protein
MLLLCRSRKLKGEWYHVILDIYILSATLKSFFFDLGEGNEGLAADLLV